MRPVWSSWIVWAIVIMETNTTVNKLQSQDTCGKFLATMNTFLFYVAAPFLTLNGTQPLLGAQNQNTSPAHGRTSLLWEITFIVWSIWLILFWSLGQLSWRRFPPKLGSYYCCPSPLFTGEWIILGTWVAHWTSIKLKPHVKEYLHPVTMVIINFLWFIAIFVPRLIFRQLQSESDQNDTRIWYN